MAVRRLSVRPRSPVNVPTPNLKPFSFWDLKGLDMYNPDELADDKRSPYARNFRLFAPSDISKRVAISKRSGHAFYSVPVGETLDTVQTSVTGAGDQLATLTTWLAQPVVITNTGRLTMVQLNVKNSNAGTGPLIVAVYSDVSGSPGVLLATSSIISSSFTGAYQYLSARFIEAPSVTATTQYWIVAYIQADGSNNYLWSSTTTATTAKTSTTSGNSWATTSYALDFKTYVSTSGSVLGQTRFYRSNGDPTQLMAFGTNVYTINDNTGAITSIKSGLNSSAVYYSWATVQDKLYWCNGIDPVQDYDGTTVAVAGGTPPTNSCNVELHQNRLFYLQPNTNYSVFSDAAAYETINVVSFIYIPSPKTADPVFRMVSYQGTMVYFSRNTKWILHGSDLASFTLRESPAKKGAVSATAITKDSNYIYFLSDDSLIYRYNGGTDQPLNAQRVWPILKNINNKSAVRLDVRDQKLYVYYASAGSAFNNHRLVYDLVYSEWLSDEEIYGQSSLSWTSQADTGQFIVASSLVGALYYGETGTNDIGKPIKFEYRTKYFSFGNPAAKHRVKRYYVFLRSQATNHTVDCQVDADEANTPVSNLIPVNQGGSLWGTGVWGTFIWGVATFLRNRISVAGANYKHQFRWVQNGVDNKVDLLGYELYILPRQPT